MILGFRAVSFKNKNIKESLKKPIRCGHTVLHRLFVDLGLILAPFWEPNRSKNRSKKPSKKRTSKKRRPRGSGTPKGIDDGDLHHRFWSSGRSPPLRRAKPLPAPRPSPVAPFFDTLASLRHTSLHIASLRHFSRHFVTLSLHFVTLSLHFAPLAFSIFRINPAGFIRFSKQHFSQCNATQHTTTNPIMTQQRPNMAPTLCQNGPKWSQMRAKKKGSL